ncbi:MAG: hydrogenase formation protein HypD, partial [Chlorobium phaeobacteroides]|nr:hydrogenase formation protein HypD [Chlorobium phaeobacteroides]
MKYIDEYRNPDLARGLLKKIENTATKPWAIMEICGGQTHSILRNGIDQLLPSNIQLVHGPGCPVCVTPLETIDRALAIAAMPETILVSFGDMLRVPGSGKDLFMARSEGADVRIVFSPLEALQIARDNPEKEVVFLAVGFETTAPANAMAVHQAAREGLGNFCELVSQVMVPPAMRAILSSPDNRVHGFL